MLHILINSDSRVCLYIVLFFLEISIPAYLKSSMEWSFELKCIETGLSYFLNVLISHSSICFATDEDGCAVENFCNTLLKYI